MASMRFKKFPVICLTALLWMPVASADDTSVDALAKAGHWKRVRQVVEQRQASLGNEAEQAYWQGRVKQAFHDLDGAETLAKKAISLDGSKSAYHLLLSSITLDQLSARPSMMRSMRLAMNTKSELETAINLDPKNIEAMRSLLEYEWSAPSIGGGDKKHARELADRIVQIEPVSGYLAQARLSELAAGSELPKAEALFKKAVDAAPRDYKARCLIAEFYYITAKNYPAAEREAKVAVTLAPDRSRAYAALAVAYAMEQKWDELDELLARAEKAVPDDLNPVYQAGKSLILEGRDYDRAERYLRKYLTQEPEGNGPQLAGAHWRLGLVYEKKGMKPKAIEELETSVRLQPALAGAKKDLERLR